MVRDLTFQDFLKTFNGRKFTLKDIRDQIFKGETITNNFLRLFNKYLDEGLIIRTDELIGNLPLYFFRNIPLLEDANISTEDQTSYIEKPYISTKDLISYIEKYFIKKEITRYNIIPKENSVTVILNNKSVIINNFENDKSIRRKLRKLIR